MKRNHFYFTIVLSLLLLPRFAFATGLVAGATEITQILNNVELLNSGASEAVTAGATLAEKIKDYSLDPVASKIANNLMNRAMSDTYTWMKSGFQGGGPGFIVNPDAYFKNVANQEIRIQLDSLQKSDNPYKSSIAVSLVKNIRTGRANIGGQLSFTLFDTIQKETCTTENLTKIATNQVDIELSTDAKESTLSRSDKIEKAKATLYNQFCTAASKNDPQARARLQTCFDVGGCGGWGSLFAAFDPQNTEYGAKQKALAVVEAKATDAVTIQKTKVSNGLIPKEICKVRLQVDETDTPYPEGEGPCVEWNIQTPVQANIAKLDQAITGAYGKLANVHSFGDLLGDVAENFVTNQVEKALYSGLSSVVSKNNGNVSNLNVTFDNFLVTTAKALPADSIKNQDAQIDPSFAVALAKAENYCANPKEEKKLNLAPVCKHLTSVKATNTIDKKYLATIISYTKIIDTLETCSNEIPASKENDDIKSFIAARRSVLADISDTDEINARLSIYNNSVIKLGAIIINITEGDDTASTKALTDYMNVISDTENVIPLQQEKLTSSSYARLLRETTKDTPKIQEKITMCTTFKCTLNPSSQECSQMNIPPPADVPKYEGGA